MNTGTAVTYSVSDMDSGVTYTLPTAANYGDTITFTPSPTAAHLSKLAIDTYLYKTWLDNSTSWSDSKRCIGRNTQTSNWQTTNWDSDCITYRDNTPDKLKPGGTYELPDGSRLVIDDKGNHRLDDANAKVVYQSNNNREFSPHLNASDMVADFVEHAGSLGVKRKDVLNLPIHLFVSWLVIEAAERDGDDVTDVVPVDQDPTLRSIIKPKCNWCGRFIKRLHHDAQFPFCSPQHATLRLQAA